MPEGDLGGGGLVSRTVRRWWPSKDDGWPRDTWLYEAMDGAGCDWFARISEPVGESIGFPPLVLVHGVVVSGTYFQPVAEELDEDFAIYVPDLPGTGRSQSRCGLLSLEGLAGKLAWWLDEHEVSGAVLVANSMGCQVLTHLAAMRPDLVRALVLVSPTMDPAVRSSIQVMIRGVIDIPREALRLWPVWLRDLTLSNPMSGLRMLRGAIRDPQMERVRHIEAPVLVVGGERDPIAPPGWIHDLADAFPNGRAMVMPGIPHAINFTNPRELARVIRVMVRSELNDPGALFE